MAAHIHLGARAKSGPVLIPLCGPCKSPASGSAKLTPAEIKDTQKALDQLFTLTKQYESSAAYLEIQRGGQIEFPCP